MNLQLSLKKVWFDMTKSRIKPEDYREITMYWLCRLFENDDPQRLDQLMVEEHLKELQSGNLNVLELALWLGWKPKPFLINTVTLGYPKKGDTERILKLEHKGIEIDTGNPEWGAEPGKLYFIIKHGKEI